MFSLSKVSRGCAQPVAGVVSVASPCTQGLRTWPSPSPQAWAQRCFRKSGLRSLHPPGTARHSKEKWDEGSSRDFSVRGDTSHRQRPGEQGLAETRWQRVSFLLSWHRLTASHGGLTPATPSWTLRPRRPSVSTPRGCKDSSTSMHRTNAKSRVYLQPARAREGPRGP